MAGQRKITIVQGAQWGSEAKGMAALALCRRLDVNWAVRTGSINAGHTVVKEDGKKAVFQQLPTGALIPGVNVALGAGAYVHKETLDREVGEADCLSRLYLDLNCGVHLDEFTAEAAAAGRNLKIGATGKGCAEAIIHKIKDRGTGAPLLFFRRDHRGYDQCCCDVALTLTDAYHGGEGILIEGTQGSLLDLHTGPYPYTTSRQTIASAWIAEAGLSPALNYEVALVARTYPIRVAGNSGPMHYETSWPYLARKMNARLALFNALPVVHPDAIEEFESTLEAVTHAMKEADRPASHIALTANTEALRTMSDDGRAEVLKLFETTTVTKRLRRIASLDAVQLRDTVKLEGAAYVILTFLNYEFPELTGARDLHVEAEKYVKVIEDEIRCPVRYVSTGPRTEDLLERRSAFAHR